MKLPANRPWTIGVVAVLGTTLIATASAQKSSVPHPVDNLAIGEERVRELLPLMNADQRGMVSKQEYMKFMEAEFERLDQQKSGQLNVKQLTPATLSAAHLAGK